MTLMERMDALEREIESRMGVLTVPPGHRIIFWTDQPVSMEQMHRFTEFTKAKGLDAILVGGMKGVLVQARINGS